MRIKSSSSTTLLVFGGFCVVLGNMIPSPGGRFLCLLVAGITALVALLFSSGRFRRLIALLVLAFAVFQAVPAWYQYSENLDRHHDRSNLYQRGGAKPHV